MGETSFREYPQLSNKRKLGTKITEIVSKGTNEDILGGYFTLYKRSRCQTWLYIKGDC